MIGANAEQAVFAPYGLVHLAAVAVCLLLVAGVAIGGRGLGAREAALRRPLATGAIFYWAVYNAWWNWTAVDLIHGLPLHICDLNGLVAPLALLTRRRWLRATAYFWTFALTAQAFVQPSITEGPALPVFWLFWIAHSLVLACAVYDLAVLGFRPDWRDLARAGVASAAYVAAIVPIDLWLGANYGFIGNPPSSVALPPFVAALGPWPQRAVIVIALAVIGFVLVLLPWRVAKAGRR
jgi:hypothetical integral membrane protein (TIGR02206 family)